MWVELRANKYVERNGKQHLYKPGTRIDIGRQSALEWVAAGDAVLIETITGDLPSNAGIVTATTAGLEAIKAIVRATDQETQIIEGPPSIPFGRTLIWDSGARLRPDFINIGFNLLARWQLAVPLWSYTELACHIGTDAEREATKAIIHDLRVPVYDTRLVFVRRCSDTKAFIDEWMKERAFGGDDKLAFHRALYRCKPVLCALPMSWTGRK